VDAKRVFFDVLKAEFAPRLRALGFNGSGHHFRRVTGEIVNAINIQGNRYGHSCAVNLGLHLTFLPIASCGDLPEARSVREIDCEFRTRLSPDMSGDYWWKYGGLLHSPSKNARHLIETYFGHSEPLFQRYDSVEKIAAMISIDDIKKQGFASAFDEITVVGAALAMARVHRHLGNAVLSRDFAAMGLQNLGRATALKDAFEELLSSGGAS
jgi:hypothetical protein